MKKIHIEGMGINGALIAQRLATLGVDFTWNDIRDPKVAWPASTGAIYPSGSSKFGPDEECRKQWLDWYDKNFIPQFLEPALFTYSTKTQPHGGKYGFDLLPSGLRVAHEESLHLNAQQLVAGSRYQFLDQETQAAPEEKNTLVIQAHSWGSRLSHVYWGWTRLVKLDYEQKLKEECLRPAFYFREGRFIMAYAYPVPGTEFWYAGSSIIKQAKDRRKSLSMKPKYDKWKENFERLSNGSVKVVEEGQFIEGWRPAAAKEDEAWVKLNGNVLQLRPLWNSGIRHFPKQWHQINSILRVE